MHRTYFFWMWAAPVLAAIALIGQPLGPGACSSDDPGTPAPIPGQVIVHVTDAAQAWDAAQAIGGVSIRSGSMDGWFLVELAPDVGVDQALARAQANPIIDAIEPNQGAVVTGQPDAPAC